MCQAQIFSSFNSLLLLSDKDWENELPTEQYFALVLSYNDKLVGRKRLSKRNKSGKRVYDLTDEEKFGLELAYKSGQSGHFGEDDVVKCFSKICSPEVSTILTGNGSRREKLRILHKLTVAKIQDNPVSYDKVERERQFLEDDQTKASFKEECDTLNFFSNPTVFDRLRGMSKDKIDEKMNLINAEIQSSLERVFTYISNSVSYVVDADIYEKTRLAAEAV